MAFPICVDCVIQSLYVAIMHGISLLLHPSLSGWVLSAMCGVSNLCVWCYKVVRWPCGMASCIDVDSVVIHLLEIKIREPK